MELVGMDFMGPITPEASDGSKYILVAVGYATKFIFLNATKEATAQVLADNVPLATSLWLSRLNLHRQQLSFF